MSEFNDSGKPCYSFTISQSDCEVDVLLDARSVEMAVMEKLVINPVLDGQHLYLQFHSHGGGAEKYAEETAMPVSLLELVMAFVDQSDMKSDSPEAYAEALVELDSQLRTAQRMVYSKARAVEAVPDPFTPGYMPRLRVEDEVAWAVWADNNGILK